ncbi:MAG: hypothetical protein JW729_09320 [Bacteroidales bacterium]|nr:hypothetical protein [Bacteroidales bacterium]
MDNLLKNIFKGVSIILMVIAAGYQIAVFYQGGSPSDVVLDGYFWIAYIAFGLSALFAILFPIIQIFQDPKAAVRTFVILAFLVVLGFVAYYLSDNTFTPAELDKMKTTADISVWVGAGLIYTYFVFVLAVVAVIYANISSLFK